MATSARVCGCDGHHEKSMKGKFERQNILSEILY
jgi:hypothetical protein